MSDNNVLPILTKQEINEVDDLQDTWHPIPQWNGRVLLRTIPFLLFEGLKKRMEHDKLSEEDFGLLLVSKSLVDPETKEPMYAFSEILALKEKSLGALMGLINAVNELNGLTELAKKVSVAASSQTVNGATSSN